jgi:hypothetical protein
VAHLKLAFSGRSRRWLSGVACSVAVCGWRGEAAACGACECADVPAPIVTLIRDVPLNLQVPLPILEGEAAEPRIERVSDGVEVVSSATRLVGAADYWWLAPQDDLEPSTEYRIIRGGGVEDQFTTGTARDEAAPRFEAVLPTAGGNAALCEASVGAQLAFSGVEDPASPSFTVWAEIEVEDGADTVRLFAAYGAGSTVRVGHSDAGCFGSTELPALTTAHTYPTRARLRDASGNASEWKQVALTVAAEQPGGCGMPSDGDNGGSVSSPEAEGANAAAQNQSASCGIGRRAPSGSWLALTSLAVLLLCRRRVLRA